MALSWNEIKRRSIEFSKEWENAKSEDSEAKSFWDSFFNVFGIPRRRVAAFEEPVRKLDDRYGFMDLFWKGTLLVEHKSKGKDLDKAYSQAMDYFAGLKNYELPKYVLVSDFERFRLHDLDEKKEYEFKLSELHDNVHLFGFMAGYTKKTYKAEDPANIKAAELMGKIHDHLFDAGYTGHPLEMFLVRTLFCLFADDTGIFEKNSFCDYVENRTSEDGSDIGMHMARLFQVLNTPIEKRGKNIDESLNAFPYINGKLFQEQLPFADFSAEMRSSLLEACYFEWSRISPAIFGSLFQSVMEPKERREIGAHYTSEENILKLIRPLFLDELQEELRRINDLKRSKKAQLEDFHKKLSELKFLDPACGCGNFLIVAYRELRLLEIEIIKELHKDSALDIGYFCRINVDQMYGIEIEEFPARIAEVAMWLVDHQMNVRLSEEFGMYYVRLPLRKAANIFHGNALRIDWNHLMHGSYFDATADTLNVQIVKEALPHYDTMNISAKKLNILDDEEIRSSQTALHTKFDYILGNPPFVGGKYQTEEQRADADLIFKGVQGAGLLDYVTCWYVKASQYIQGTKNKVAFVSTNSISQGEQVGVLWNELFKTYHIKIHFAHRTFAWSSEARGKAHVHVVIIGFAAVDTPNKSIYEYENIKGEAHAVKASNINPYLVDAANVCVTNRYDPICHVPKIGIGNKPIDDGNYLFSGEEKVKFVEEEPNSAQYFHRWLGSVEFLHSIERWVLWLGDASPKDLKGMPKVMERIAAVRNFRLGSKSIPTRKLAESPTRFHVENMPDGDYLLIPKVSSERRKYIPIGFITRDVISSDLVHILKDANLFQFGVLTSIMHICWVKNVCGRLKSDYRYSNKLVYNNFPWPEAPTEKQVKDIEEKAQKVLDARANHPESSLADLYDPLTMPPDLLNAHNELDKAVDRAYGKPSFASDMERIEFLFDLYKKITQ